MKQYINGVLVDVSAEEKALIENQQETNKAKHVQERADAEAKQQAIDELKASAKAKLIAGEALTEEEANTVVV